MKKQRAEIYLILVVAILLISCRSAGNAPTLSSTPQQTSISQLPIETPLQTAERPITLKLVVDAALTAPYQEWITLFESENPDIAVELMVEDDVIATDRIESTVEQLARVADVLPFSPTYREEDLTYLLDLQPLIESDPNFASDDFWPGLLRMHGDAIYSLPTFAIYRLLYFDPQAFERAGIPYPQPGWTFDQFLLSAQELTVRDGEEVIQWGYVPLDLRYSPILASHLTAPLIGDGQVRFLDEDVFVAVQSVTDLFTRYRVSPPLLSLTDMTGQLTQITLMGSGQAAMWQRGHSLWESYSEFGVTTTPVTEQGYTAEPQVYGFAISRGSQHIEAAWKLLNFISRQSPITPIGEQLVTPARKSVANALDYWSTVPDELRPTLQFAVEHSQPPRFSIESAVLIGGVIEAVLQDGVPIVDALTTAQAIAQEDGTVATHSVEPFVVVTSEPQDTRVTVNFATTWNEINTIRELLPIFEAEHPDVVIRLERIDTAAPVNQDRAVASADCLVNYTHRMEYFDAPLLPLTPLVELDNSLELVDFYPQTIAALSREGQLIGLPAWSRVRYIEYNQALFDAAGISPPNPDWTLLEFLEIAQTLSDPSVEQYGFVDWEHTFLIDGIAQFAPQVINEEAQTFDFAATEEMLQWYVDLVRLQAVQPAMPGYFINLDDVNDRVDLSSNFVSQQRVGMWIAADQLLARTLQEQNVVVGRLPIPRGPTGYNGPFSHVMAAYYIKEQTPHRQLCWEWIKFLSKQVTIVDDSLPSRIEVAESAEFADHIGAAKARLFQEAIQHSDPGNLTSLHGWYNPALLWLGIVYEEAVKEGSGIRTNLAEMQERFDAYRACVRENDAFDDEDGWQACAMSADERLRARFLENEG